MNLTSSLYYLPRLLLKFLSVLNRIKVVTKKSIEQCCSQSSELKLFFTEKENKFQVIKFYIFLYIRIILKFLFSFIISVPTWSFVIIGFLRYGLFIVACVYTNPDYIIFFHFFIPIIMSGIINGMVRPFFHIYPKKIKKEYTIDKNQQDDDEDDEEGDEENDIAIGSEEEEDEDEDEDEEEEEFEPKPEPEEEPEKKEIELKEVKFDIDNNNKFSIKKDNFNVDNDHNDYDEGNQLEEKTITISNVLGKFGRLTILPPYFFDYELLKLILIIILTIVTFIICFVSFFFLVIGGESIDTFLKNQNKSFSWLVDWGKFVQGLNVSKNDGIGLGCTLGSIICVIIYSFFLKLRELKKKFQKEIENCQMKEYEILSREKERMRNKNQPIIKESEKIALIRKRIKRKNLLNNQNDDEQEDNIEVEININPGDERSSQLKNTTNQILKYIPPFSASRDNVFICQEIILPFLYLIPSLLIFKENWQPILDNAPYTLLFCVALGIFGRMLPNVGILLFEGVFNPFSKITPKELSIFKIRIGKIHNALFAITRFLTCFILQVVLFKYYYNNFWQIYCAIMFLVVITFFMIFQ